MHAPDAPCDSAGPILETGDGRLQARCYWIKTFTSIVIQLKINMYLLGAVYTVYRKKPETERLFSGLTRFSFYLLVIRRKVKLRHPLIFTVPEFIHIWI